MARNRYANKTVEQLADQREYALTEMFEAGSLLDGENVEFWRNIVNEIEQELLNRGLTF